MVVDQTWVSPVKLVKIRETHTHKVVAMSNRARVPDSCLSEKNCIVHFSAHVQDLNTLCQTLWTTFILVFACEIFAIAWNNFVMIPARFCDVGHFSTKAAMFLPPWLIGYFASIFQVDGAHIKLVTEFHDVTGWSNILVFLQLLFFSGGGGEQT